MIEHRYGVQQCPYIQGLAYSDENGACTCQPAEEIEELEPKRAPAIIWVD